MSAVRASRRQDPIPHLYPEIEAGGFTRNDQRVIFYARVNALLDKAMTVVDFGAGRDRWSEIDKGFMGRLTNLKGKCRKLIGADVDPIVCENKSIDEALVLPMDGTIPLPDGSVDLVVSWAVFEHLADPAKTAAEFDRILKPGGWICAWTPNKWGYVGMGARLVPDSLHVRVLRYVQPASSKREERDVFPTLYRLNTLGELRRHFPENRFEHFSYTFSGIPAYHADRMILARSIALFNKLVPQRFAQALHVFIRKR